MFDLVSSFSVFDKLSDATGIQVDQITFILTQFLGLFIAPIFCSVLHPSKTSPAVRQTVSLVLGAVFGLICFGRQLLHLFGLSTFCYILLKTVDPLKVQWIILIVTLTYLSIMHLYRLIFEYASYSLDITGPLMVIVQKLTSLAFILHDNIKSKKDGSENGKVVFKITSVPSVLEFYGYIFNFQTLMVGPLLFFNDYMDWVSGENFSKHERVRVGSSQNTIAPSALMPILKKVVASVSFGVLYVILIPKFPSSKIIDDEYLEKWSVFSQILYLYICTGLVRFMYYHAWLLTDAVCNASGLGFNGFDDYGVARWDLLTNVDIFKFEFGTNLKEVINNWNKGTNKWLRLVVYNRTKKFSTVLTFSLSALWHGFYPGYYITFASGALFISAARVIRRKIRPYFQVSASHVMFYDLVTILTTRIAMAYMIFPFIILEFLLSMRVYLYMYFWMHILAVFAVFLLPYFPSHGPQSETFSVQLTQSSNNLVTTSIHG